LSDIDTERALLIAYIAVPHGYEWELLLKEGVDWASVNPYYLTYAHEIAEI